MSYQFEKLFEMMKPDNYEHEDLSGKYEDGFYVYESKGYIEKEFGEEMDEDIDGDEIQL